MTPDVIIHAIFDAELQGRPDAFARILNALAAKIPAREPNNRDDYSDDEVGRIVFESAEASDDAWEWLREELMHLARKVKSSAELYI